MLAQVVDWAPSSGRWRFLFGETPDGDALVNCWVESSLVAFASMILAGRLGGTCRLGHCKFDCTWGVEVGLFLVVEVVGQGMFHTV